MVFERGDALARVGACGYACEREGAFEGVQRHAVGDGFDQAARLAGHEDAHAFGPDGDLGFLPDLGADLDQLAGEGFLAEVVARLDDDGDEVPVGHVAIGRGAADALAFGAPFLAEGRC